MYRFLKIKDSLPWGLQKDGEDVFEHVMDLSTEDKAKTDSQKRTLYAAYIKEKYDFDLVEAEDVPVVQAKIDGWLADSSTATTEEILADALSLLRDKGLLYWLTKKVGIQTQLKYRYQYFLTITHEGATATYHKGG